MKNIVLSIISILIVSLSGVMAQNPGWSLPPYYWNGFIAQPLPTTPNGYQGDSATCTSNMQLDANKDILFFIVDDKIYNKEGYLIGDLTNAASGIPVPYSPSQQYHLKGTAEISIVPV